MSRSSGLALNTLLYGVFGLAAWTAAFALSLAGGPVPLAMALPWLIGVPLLLFLAVVVSSPRRAARLGPQLAGFEPDLLPDR